MQTTKTKRSVPCTGGVILNNVTTRNLKLVFPARAGVILNRLNFSCYIRSVPRTGGGDPGSDERNCSGTECSPHGRG